MGVAARRGAGIHQAEPLCIAIARPEALCGLGTATIDAPPRPWTLGIDDTTAHTSVHNTSIARCAAGVIDTLRPLDTCTGPRIADERLVAWALLIATVRTGRIETDAPGIAVFGDGADVCLGADVVHAGPRARTLGIPGTLHETTAVFTSLALFAVRRVVAGLRNRDAGVRQDVANLGGCAGVAKGAAGGGGRSVGPGVGRRALIGQRGCVLGGGCVGQRFEAIDRRDGAVAGGRTTVVLAGGVATSAVGISALAPARHPVERVARASEFPPVWADTGGGLARSAGSQRAPAAALATATATATATSGHERERHPKTEA